MRKIKFRAWFEGHMYEVAKLDFWGDPEQATCDLAGPGENGEGEELFDICVGEVELMQSTGLKDKNGTEIYEGDILGKTFHWDLFVKFQNGKFMLHDTNLVRRNNDYIYDLYRIVVEGYCVTGNIFENPELIGG